VFVDRSVEMGREGLTAAARPPTRSLQYRRDRPEPVSEIVPIAIPI